MSGDQHEQRKLDWETVRRLRAGDNPVLATLAEKYVRRDERWKAASPVAKLWLWFTGERP